MKTGRTASRYFQTRSRGESISRCQPIRPPTARFLIMMTVLALALTGCAGTVKNRGPEFVSGEGPRYPQQAREDGLEGYVVVEYRVSAEGAVLSPRVVESKPVAVFDQAALLAVSGWKYRPQVKDGVFVETPRIRSTLTFKLSSEANYPER